MAEQNQQNASKIREGQVGNLSRDRQTTPEDVGADGTLERVEVLAAGAEGRNDIEADDLGEKLNELAVTTEVEVDALRMNLVQDDYPPSARNSSGRIVDDFAQERIARFTEADPMQADIGAVSVEPGLDDTSSVLRRRHPNTTIARSDAVVEGNLDEPMDETITERKVGEGTAG